MKNHWIPSPANGFLPSRKRSMLSTNLMNHHPRKEDSRRPPRRKDRPRAHHRHLGRRLDSMARPHSSLKANAGLRAQTQSPSNCNPHQTRETHAVHRTKILASQLAMEANRPHPRRYRSRSRAPTSTESQVGNRLPMDPLEPHHLARRLSGCSASHRHQPRSQLIRA